MSIACQYTTDMTLSVEFFSKTGHSANMELQQRRHDASAVGRRSPGHHVHHMDPEQDPDGGLGPACLDAPRLPRGPDDGSAVGTPAHRRHNGDGVSPSKSASDGLVRWRGPHLVHKHTGGG